MSYLANHAYKSYSSSILQQTYKARNLILSKKRAFSKQTLYLANHQVLKKGSIPKLNNKFDSHMKIESNEKFLST